MSDDNGKKMKRLDLGGMPSRLFGFIPQPGKCICGEPVANDRGDEFEKYACAEHAPVNRAADERRKRERYDEQARVMRELLVQRVDCAVPATYAPMQVLGPGADGEAALRMFEDRISVVDSLKLIQDIEAAAKDMIEVRGTIVLFAGPTGVGKSHALALLLRYMAMSVPLLPVRTNPTTMKGGNGIFSEEWDDDESSDPYVLWRNAPDLFDDVVRRNESLWPLKHVAVAALDDIGKEPIQINATPVQDIVWNRYDNLRTIAASTGFVDPKADPSDVDAFLAPLAARYDKAFVRRLAKVPQRVRIIPMLPPEG